MFSCNSTTCCVNCIFCSGAQHKSKLQQSKLIFQLISASLHKHFTVYKFYFLQMFEMYNFKCSYVRTQIVLCATVEHASTPEPSYHGHQVLVQMNIDFNSTFTCFLQISLVTVPPADSSSPAVRMVELSSSTMTCMPGTCKPQFSSEAGSGSRMTCVRLGWIEL